MDKSVWHRRFTEKNIPLLPCPSCNHGRLVSEVINYLSPNYAPDDFEDLQDHPELDVNRFTLFLRCNNRACGEVVACAGDVVQQEVGDELTGFSSAQFLCPYTMFPAPPIISVPHQTPAAVKTELEKSFRHFWGDPESSASRLRSSVERLMDHFKIPKTKLSPRRGGRKRLRLDLYNRIEKFCSAAERIVHSDALHALRTIGNLGTHGSIEGKVLLEAFEVYEYALQEIINQRSKEIKKAAKILRNQRQRTGG